MNQFVRKLWHNTYAPLIYLLLLLVLTTSCALGTAKPVDVPESATTLLDRVVAIQTSTTAVEKSLGQLSSYQGDQTAKVKQIQSDITSIKADITSIKASIASINAKLGGSQ